MIDPTASASIAGALTAGITYLTRSLGRRVKILEHKVETVTSHQPRNYLDSPDLSLLERRIEDAKEHLRYRIDSHVLRIERIEEDLRELRARND